MEPQKSPCCTLIDGAFGDVRQIPVSGSSTFRVDIFFSYKFFAHHHNRAVYVAHETHWAEDS